MRPPLHHGRDRQPEQSSSGPAPPSRSAAQKVLVGVRKACQGRPVTEDDLALLAQRVEESIRAQGSAEIEAHEVGLAVLEPLRELDEVAYLRFASVYQAFDTLEDFEAAITLLRAERDATGEEPGPDRRPAHRRQQPPDQLTGIHRARTGTSASSAVADCQTSAIRTGHHEAREGPGKGSHHMTETANRAGRAAGTARARA